MIPGDPDRWRTEYVTSSSERWLIIPESWATVPLMHLRTEHLEDLIAWIISLSSTWETGANSSVNSFILWKLMSKTSLLLFKLKHLNTLNLPSWHKYINFIFSALCFHDWKEKKSSLTYSVSHSFIRFQEQQEPQCILYLKPQWITPLLIPPLITVMDCWAIISVWVPPPSQLHPTSHPVPHNQGPNFTRLLTNVTNGKVREGRVWGEGPGRGEGEEIKCTTE